MLLPFFEWCEETLVGTVVRDSLWLFPVIESAHLLGLCLLGGALLTVDLRLLGLGLTGTSVQALSAYMRPWLTRGILLMVGTGLFLFLSEAIKLYYSPSFWVKITTLPAALVFTYAVRERLAGRGRLESRVLGRVVGFASIGFWFVVAAAGRWIGFS